jgi:uncharacterized protein (DUF1499 family)
MKVIVIALITCSALFVVFLIYQGRISQTGSAAGLSNGKLIACPSSPNCICTEFPDDSTHYLAPLHLPAMEAEEVLARSTTIITTMGGLITNTTDHYLAATFTSKLFRFVDDVEVRWDNDARTLHIRSASRVGHDDVGANKKRVSQFLQHWKK